LRDAVAARRQRQFDGPGARDRSKPTAIGLTVTAFHSHRCSRCFSKKQGLQAVLPASRTFPLPVLRICGLVMS
jgi:hypothetical protein